MFEETEEYFHALSGPPDPVPVAAIAQRYGVKSVGPPIEVASAALQLNDGTHD